MLYRSTLPVLFVALLLVRPAAAQDDAPEPHPIALAEGALLLEVPGGWEPVKPKFRIIAHEFSLPAAEGDPAPGRMTISTATGGTEANIARWIGQFRSPEGGALQGENKKVEKKSVDGLEVHLVDLRGDFQDRPGPFAPRAVNRPNYRMLGAIVPTEGSGTWFLKLYGPAETMKAAEKGFRKMIEGLRKGEN